MATWLYQLSADAWSVEEYRQTVKEGKTLSWHVGRIGGQGENEVTAGDTIIFFFCKSHTDEPGIYGWGEIKGFIDNGAKDRRVKFVVKPPSDALKMRPCWNNKVERLIDAIRGNVKMGTLWKMTDKEFAVLRKEMFPSAWTERLYLCLGTVLLMVVLILVWKALAWLFGSPRP